MLMYDQKNQSIEEGEEEEAGEEVERQKKHKTSFSNFEQKPKRYPE